MAKNLCVRLLKSVHHITYANSTIYIFVFFFICWHCFSYLCIHIKIFFEEMEFKDGHGSERIDDNGKFKYKFMCITSKINII